MGHGLEQLADFPTTLNKHASEDLENLRRMAPKHFSFNVPDLDEIEAGENLEQHRISVIDGTYLFDFGQRLDWWLALWELLTETDSDETQYKTVCQLADDVISRWAKIRLERPVAEKKARKLNDSEFDVLYRETTDADLDLVRRYRRLTRFLYSSAEVFWPEVELGWLRATA